MNSPAKSVKVSVFILMLISLSACFGGTTPVKPEIQLRSERLIEEAIRAEQKNEIKRAEALLEESLQLSTSIEDNSSAARTLINLARLHRINQQMPASRNAIEAALLILTNKMEIYPEAAQEKASIELTTGNIAAALAWAQKSVDASKGAPSGRLLNLVGRILLLQNKNMESAEILKKALKLNITENHIEEQSNSLRMLGIIARKSKNYGDSERLLFEALELDKSIAVSSKIGIDLEELSLTARNAGQLEKSISFLQRAYLVHFSGGRLLQAKSVQDRCTDVFEVLNDKVNADKSRATVKMISEMLKDQSKENVSETIKPSKSP